MDSLFQYAQKIESQSQLKAHERAKFFLKLSKEYQYKEGIVKAELFLSESYTRGKNHQLGLYYANEAERSITDFDFDLKAKVLRLKGINLARYGFYQVAAKHLKDAIFYAEKVKLPDDRNENLGYIYADMAENYQKNEVEKDSIGYYYLRSFHFFDQINNENLNKNRHMAFANVNLGTFNLKEQKFEKALPYFDKALILSKQYDLDFITIEALSGLGSINYYRDFFKQAQVDFYDALLLAKNKDRIFYVNDLYYNLWSTYKKLNVKDSSSFYKEKYIVLNDSLLKSNKSNIEYSLRLFLQEKDKKTTSQVYLIAICIGVVLLIILISFMYMRLHNRGLKRLNTEMATLDEQLLRKQELIQKLLNQKRSTEVELNELIDLVMSGNPSFFNKFKESHGDYIDKIIGIAPNMLLSELRFCAMVKLGFSSVEIATYTKSTIRSVESRRYRIRKKINVPSDVDLNEWLVVL